MILKHRLQQLQLQLSSNCKGTQEKSNSVMPLISIQWSFFFALFNPKESEAQILWLLNEKRGLIGNDPVIEKD